MARKICFYAACTMCLIWWIIFVYNGDNTALILSNIHLAAVFVICSNSKEK